MAAAVPFIDDVLLVLLSNLDVVIRYDNHQLEIKYTGSYEPQGVGVLDVAPLNTVITDSFGNIAFSPAQGGVNIYNANFLRNYFANLNLVGVTNNI